MEEGEKNNKRQKIHLTRGFLNVGKFSYLKLAKICKEIALKEVLNWGELERLQNKANRLIANQPPQIRVITLQHDEELPDDWSDNEWGMIVRIESPIDWPIHRATRTH